MLNSEKTTDAARAHYKELLETIRLSPEDIGQKVGVSRTTVSDVLSNKRVHFASEETIKRIFQQIDREAKDLGDALNRLSKGATE